MIEIEKKTSFIPLASLETSHAYKVDLQLDENNSWQLITKREVTVQYGPAREHVFTHTVQEQEEE